MITVTDLCEIVKLIIGSIEGLIENKITVSCLIVSAIKTKILLVFEEKWNVWPFLYKRTKLFLEILSWKCNIRYSVSKETLYIKCPVIRTLYSDHLPKDLAVYLCLSPPGWGQRSPAKAHYRWSECNFLITGYDCFSTSPFIPGSRYHLIYDM